MLDLVEEIESYSPQTGNSKPTNSYIIDQQPNKPVLQLKETLAPQPQQP